MKVTVQAQWKVEFRKVREQGLRYAIHRVTEVTEVVVYAKNSTEAIEYATTYVGGIATKDNVCCVTKLI